MFLLALTSLLSPVAASQLIEGDALRVAYNSNGTWNDTGLAQGLEAYLDGSWVPLTYPGVAHHLVSVEYTAGSSNLSAYSLASGSTTFTVSGETDLGAATAAGSAYTWTTGNLQIDKIETWDVASQLMRVQMTFTNTGIVAMTRLRVLYAVDPDPDATAYFTYNTFNDAQDIDGDGTSDWVQSVGASSGYTLGMGACAPSATSLGHYSSWSSVTDADTTLSDGRGASADNAMGLRWTNPDTLLAGASVTTVFFVSVGVDAATAQDAFVDARATLCDEACDADGDGVSASACGGEDCDDADAAVYAGAPEIWYDGVDGDCAGNDDFDADGDGSQALDYGGDDCDDLDAARYPGASDAWYDGVDSDCAGNDDYDADGDGHGNAGFGGDDCNDASAAVFPGARETFYDGVDSNCDPDDEYDADGDGHASAGFGGDDCNESNAAVYPGAPETFHDGVDSNCDPSDEDDADGDGHDDVAFGGDDCDDVNAGVNPDAVEVPYDDVDQDCDGLQDDDDWDGDGVSVPDDCDDGDAAIQTGCPDADTGSDTGTDTATGGDTADEGSSRSDRSDGETKTVGGCSTTGSPMGSASLAAMAALALGLRSRRARA